MRLSRFCINSELSKHAPRRTLAIVAFALSAALACALCLPTQAFADYSNPSVSTVAQMRTDGSLHVVEQRSYAFEEDYSAVTWRFTGITDKQEVEVASVRIIQMDAEGNIVRDWDQLEEVAFQSSWREFVSETEGVAEKVAAAEEKLAASEDSSEVVELPSHDSYAFDKRRCELYVFLESTEHSTVIECDYAISNAALVYDDTAEMYWDYAPAQPDVEMSNVRTQIQLPVPEGVEVAPGETVLAWGHGPAGEVDVRADGTVHYTVPEVRAGQYAQAHVLFPRAWLTNITVQSKLAKSGTRFDDAVAEEASWTDTYSWGRVNEYSIDLAAHALCIVVLLGAVLAYFVWGRERRPDPDAGTYLPSGCEAGEPADACRASEKAGEACGVDAAVLGRLLRWNQHSAYDFAATLEQLRNRGVISISDGDGKQGDGANVERAVPMTHEEASCPDVRFRITPSAKSAKLSAVEQAAMELLFDEVGDGYQSVSLADVQRFCEGSPAAAREAMARWQDVLTEEVRDARVFDPRSKKASHWMYGIAGVLLALAFLAAAAHDLSIAACLFATSAVVFAIGYNMPRRTPRGVELAEAAERSMFDDGPACHEPWQVALANAFGDALTK